MCPDITSQSRDEILSNMLTYSLFSMLPCHGCVNIPLSTELLCARAADRILLRLLQFSQSNLALFPKALSSMIHVPSLEVTGRCLCLGVRANDWVAEKCTFAVTLSLLFVPKFGRHSTTLLGYGHSTALGKELKVISVLI